MEEILVDYAVYFRITGICFGQKHNENGFFQDTGIFYSLNDAGNVSIQFF